MTIDINARASAIAFDMSVSGSMPNINIDADSLDFDFVLRDSVYSSFPTDPRYNDIDLVYNCLGYDRLGNRDQGVLVFTPTISGVWTSIGVTADTIPFDFAISATFIEGKVLNESSNDIAFAFSISGDIIIEMAKTSWVRWSDIGSADFIITHSNVAGERPMEWTGVIYDIFKLNKTVMIYGSNGISSMTPVDINWDYRTVSRIGTKGRDAQISNSINTKHWFIDVNGKLYEIGESISKLDYSEYLSSLTNPVLSLDEENNLLYICDGTTGYCYSIDDKSLGSCAPNITGFGFKNGSSYITAPAAITLPMISFVTDIYDLGTRKEKTIFNVEVDTNVAEDMEVAISYRMNHTAAFVMSPWVPVTIHGIGYIPCYCREFKLHFKMPTYADFNLDQVKINGVIHGFSFLDTTRREN